MNSCFTDTRVSWTDYQEGKKNLIYSFLHVVEPTLDTQLQILPLRKTLWSPDTYLESKIFLLQLKGKEKIERAI